MRDVSRGLSVCYLIVLLSLAGLQGCTLGQQTSRSALEGFDGNTGQIEPGGHDGTDIGVRIANCSNEGRTLEGCSGRVARLEQEGPQACLNHAFTHSSMPRLEFNEIAEACGIPQDHDGVNDSPWNPQHASNSPIVTNVNVDDTIQVEQVTSVSQHPCRVRLELLRNRAGGFEGFTRFTATEGNYRAEYRAGGATYYAKFNRYVPPGSSPTVENAITCFYYGSFPGSIPNTASTNLGSIPIDASIANQQ